MGVSLHIGKQEGLERIMASITETEANVQALLTLAGQAVALLQTQARQIADLEQRVAQLQQPATVGTVLTAEDQAAVDAAAAAAQSASAQLSAALQPPLAPAAPAEAEPADAPAEPAPTEPAA